MATIAIPKTVTSKKGNLSIVSENLKARHVLKKHRRHLGRRLSTSIESSAPSEGSFSAITVDDLASSVLNFGSKGNESVCLDIQQMTTSSSQEPKIVRPGFSARRYLSSWTKTLDEDTVNTWLSLGKLSEKTIFQTNAFLPHLRKRANDNLSEYPAPYRIVKQMLIAPGPLNEYSFIWGKKEVSDDGLSRGDIQVFSEDKAELVKYSDLDKNTQKGILSKLLVKSALSYGLTKAQESQTAEPGEGATDASSSAGQFDMVHAVRSLLDRDTNALREEDDRSGGGGGAGSTGEEFSPDDERIFERIRQKRLRESKLRRQKLLQQRSRRSGASGSNQFAMQGEHVGPEFEPPEWERPARPTDGTGGFLPPLVEDQLPMATRSLRNGEHEDGLPGRRPKLPRLAVSLDATGSNDSEEEDGGGDTVRREAADRVMELPFEGQARSGPVLFGSMPRARGVWGNFSQRGRPQPSPLQQQQKQQQEQQQKADSGRGAHLKTADLFLGAEPESRISTAEDDASTDSNDLASVRLKTRKARQDARSNLRARSPVKREVNLHGGDFDATKFLVAHKAADGLLSAEPSPAATPPSPLTLQSEEDEAEEAGLAAEDGHEGLQLGGRGLIAPAHIGPGGERVDVAAMSQDQLMSVLTQHAEEVAESVLKNQTAGQDIAEDVQKAITDLMTQRAIGIPAQPRRRAGGGQAGNAAAIRRSREARKGAAATATAAQRAAELQDGVDGVGGHEVSGDAAEKTAEAAASGASAVAGDFDSLAEEDADEAYNEEAEAEEELRAQEEEAAFKDAIKTALISAITKSAGGADESDSADEDIELPDDILEMLAAPGSGGLQPSDLVVVIDPLTGRRVISTRERLVQQAMAEAQADPEAALAQMQATASQGQLPPLLASPSASLQHNQQQQTQKATEEEKTLKQAKPKEAFRVPRVVHKDSIQSVFTGDVSREASNVEELVLPRIPSNLLKSAAAAASAAAAEPGRKPDGKTRRLKASKKKPPKQGAAQPAAAAAETPKASEDKKTGKKKGAGKKAASVAGRKDSIAPGAEGAIEDEEGDAVQRPEEEMSFVRVDDYFSDEEGANRDPTTMMAVDDDASAAGASSSMFPPGEGGDDVDDAEFERQLQEQMRRMNVKEQRELRRRAEAERRRRETERRRKEAAEKRRRDQEAAERQSQLEQEMEAERLRKEEEVRERRRLEREARERAEAEAEAAERREQLAKDREQRERENFMRKLQEARRQKEEEEQRRRFEEMMRQEEEERLRQEEEAKLAQMEETERLEYLRRKAEEEEQRRLEEEAERQRQEAEAKKALEEARRLAEELATVRAAELARRRFQRSLRIEKAGHERYLSVKPAFVFSYFALLKWVGVDFSNAVKASKAAKA